MTLRKGVFDNKGLNIMQEAMDRACAKLEIKQEDRANRKRVAFLVAGFTRAGVYDVDGLTDHVVTQFKIPV